MEKWFKVGAVVFLISLLLRPLTTDNLADPDLWGYLAFGRLFWHNQAFPYKDVFSYVPTVPWVYHEWLTGVLFFPLFQIAGGTLLQLLKYCLGLGTAGLIYLTARKRGARPVAAAVFLLIVFIPLAHNSYSPVRAQVFTFFFFALSLYLLERARLQGRWGGLYLIPLIQVFWCNLHGGFLAGLGLMAIYGAGESLARRRSLPYFTVLVLSILATLINPYGIEYWQYLVQAVSMPRPHITEWESVFQAYRTGNISALLVTYLAVLIFFGCLAMWRSHWRDLTASLALAVTLGLGLKHIRHLPFFLMVTGAYLPVCLNANIVSIQNLVWIKKLRANFRLKVGALILLSLFTVLNIYSSISNHPLSLRLLDTANPLGLHAKVNYPVTAVNLIKKLHLSGKILTKFVWGEYLIWELYPQCRVTLDGRYETVYPRKVVEDYAKFYYAGPQWRQFLQDYPPDLILLDKQMAVAGLLRKDSHWREVYADAGCVLFKAKDMAGKVSPEEWIQKDDQPRAGVR